MGCLSDGAKVRVWAIISEGGTVLCFASLAVLPKLTQWIDIPPWAFRVGYSLDYMLASLAFLGVLRSLAMVSWW